MAVRAFDPYEDMLGEIYCLTFVRDLDETEALRRMGGLEDTLRPRSLADVREEQESYDAGCPEIAQALKLGAWTVVIEPNGFHGSNVQLLSAVSRGTEAVSALRHDYADARFRYSVDGTFLTGFIRSWPSVREGSEPDRLIAQMRAARLDLEREDGDDVDSLVDHAAMLRLVHEITGFLPDVPDGPLPSAHIEP